MKLKSGKVILLVLLMLTGHWCTAQLCTGSLGDPIVNIDFGSGTGRGPALGSAITAYTYNGTGQLDEGEYTIANTTSGLKGNAWHVTTDHTGNTNGYMMVVNCATLATEGVFYTKTVTDLCPGTTYEFSAWLMNIMNGTDQYHPNITFRVSTTSGTLLGSYQSGDMPNTSSPVWNQFGFYFTTTTETSVVITILNSAPSARPGNDVALDDIVFRPCGPSVIASISGGSTTLNTCEGKLDSVKLVSTLSGGYSNPKVQWQKSTDSGKTWTDISGATTLSLWASYSGAGYYLYRMVTAEAANIASTNCRIASNEIKLVINSNPKITKSSNNPVCYTDSLVLKASSTSTGASYQWTGPSGFASANQNTTISGLSAATNGWYYITVTSTSGCSSTDSLKVAASSNPTADAGIDTTICPGTSYILSGTTNASSYYWTPGSTLSDSLSLSTSATPKASTWYYLVVKNGTCANKDSIQVKLYDKTVANAGADQYMLEGTNVTLTGTVSGSNTSFFWTPSYAISSVNTLTPTVNPSSDTSYVLHVLSGNGCAAAYDTVRVTVYKSIKIPNTITPNGDGVNDYWVIEKIQAYTKASLVIFNRWGQIVYKSTGYQNNWNGKYNGKDLPVGTYYYTLDLNTVIPLRYSGFIMILR